MVVRKGLGIVGLVSMLAFGCQQEKGVVSVGIGAQDNFLSERDALRAAEELMRYALSRTNVWKAAPGETNRAGDRWLVRNPGHTNAGSFYSPGDRAHVIVEYKNEHWITATLERWP